MQQHTSRAIIIGRVSPVEDRVQQTGGIDGGVEKVSFFGVKGSVGALQHLFVEEGVDAVGPVRYCNGVLGLIDAPETCDLQGSMHSILSEGMQALSKLDASAPRM